MEEKGNNGGYYGASYGHGGMPMDLEVVDRTCTDVLVHPLWVRDLDESPTMEVGITSYIIKVQSMRVNMETEINAKERFENANTI